MSKKQQNISRLEKNLKILIKRRLQEKGWNYHDLAAEMKVKVLTVRRWMTSRPMKLNRFIELMQLLDINLFSHLDEDFSRQNKSTEYTLEQELYLSRNPISALIFLKLVVGYKLDDLMATYGLSQKNLLHILYQLEKVKLLQLWPGEKIKVKVRGPFRSIPGGPNSKTYFPIWVEILQNHFRDNFQKVSEPFEQTEISVFRPFELYLNPQSAQEFAKEMIVLFSKYRQLNAIEYSRRSNVIPVSGIMALDSFDSWEKVFLNRAGFLK